MRKKIFWVDDYMPLMSHYVTALQSRYDVMTASGVAQALSILIEQGKLNNFALVLLDAQMPPGPYGEMVDEDTTGQVLYDELRKAGMESLCIIFTNVVDSLDLGRLKTEPNLYVISKDKARDSLELFRLVYSVLG